MSSVETLNRPDVDLDDFDVPCDLQVALVFPSGRSNSYQCEEPARWAGLYPCCGKVAMVCDPHHADDNPFYCSKCKRHAFTLINWTRL